MSIILSIIHYLNLIWCANPLSLFNPNFSSDQNTTHCKYLLYFLINLQLFSSHLHLHRHNIHQFTKLALLIVSIYTSKYLYSTIHTQTYINLYMHTCPLLPVTQHATLYIYLYTYTHIVLYILPVSPIYTLTNSRIPLIHTYLYKKVTENPLFLY